MTRLARPLVAALLLWPSGLMAQTPEALPVAVRPEAKSVTTARVLGIIPGAGHFYAGETGRGFAFIAGVLLPGMIAGLGAAAECIGEEVAGKGCEPSSQSSLTVTDVATYAVWGWSIFDAGRAAQRTNAKRGVPVSLSVMPTRTANSRGTTPNGLRWSVRIGQP
jgi:hypothetical protein